MHFHITRTKPCSWSCTRKRRPMTSSTESANDSNDTLIEYFGNWHPEAQEESHLWNFDSLFAYQLQKSCLLLSQIEFWNTPEPTTHSDCKKTCNPSFTKALQNFQDLFDLAPSAEPPSRRAERAKSPADVKTTTLTTCSLRVSSAPLTKASTCVHDFNDQVATSNVVRQHSNLKG